MPQVVAKYMETHDFKAVDRVKRDILGLIGKASKNTRKSMRFGLKEFTTTESSLTTSS